MPGLLTPPSWQTPAAMRRCHIIGFASLICYLATWLAGFDFSRSFEPLLMLVYLIAISVRPLHGRGFIDPLWLLLLVWLLIQLVTLPPAMALFPDYADEQIKDMRGLTKVFLILPIAWVLAGSTRLVLLALSTLIVGTMAGSLIHGESPTMLATLLAAGERPTLGFQNWQHAGVCAGVTLIATACFAPRLIRDSAQRPTAQRVALRVAFSLVAAWSLMAWTVSMTRSAWLGIAVVSLVAVIGAAIVWRRGYAFRTLRVRHVLLALAATLSVALLMGITYGDPIIDRITAEQGTVAAVLRGDLSAVPSTSIGFRIHAWHYALQLLEQKPWFGWGPKSHIPLLLQSTNPVENTTLGAVVERSNLRHFHSSYVTLLVGNGVIGALVYLATIATVAKAAWGSWRRGRMPTDVAIFLCLFFVFWAVVNAFESYIAYATGIYFVGAVGAVAYTYRMRERLDRQRVARTESA
ncbi:O-antigen ligase family protein [Salinicola halophilus]|uniref:O-antigen ligase family protein n=1 Tax=Salinicola halophilus TaxID=184065 RepID=UPI000DA16111|nr:O-antigen ligase family protein [Salinicola halophilus]